MRRPALVLFAGGGGSTLGAHAAGFDCIGVEWDEVAASVHNAHAGPCIHADVRDLAAWVARVLEHAAGLPLTVWASPPCQDWSAAGNRAGASGDRNGWPWTFDAIRALRAAGVVVDALVTENVGGMLHHLTRAGCHGGTRPNPAECPGCYWRTVVAEAATMFPHVTWRLLDAADYGVPQHRERVIMVASSAPYRWPFPSHHPIGGLLTPWWRTTASSFGVSSCPECLDSGAECTACEGIGSVCACGPVIDESCRGRWFGGGSNPAPSRGRFERTERELTDVPSTTIPAEYFRNAFPRLRCECSGIDRNATPDECALLQGWPEVVPHLPRADGEPLDAYRIVGNAVPPPLARAVCEVLL